MKADTKKHNGRGVRDAERSGAGSERDSTGARSFSRRSFCKVLAGSTFAAAGLASVDRVAALEDDYRTVINLEDEGVSLDASKSVSPRVERLLEDDALVRFPQGNYFMDEEVRMTNFENVAVVGEDATIVPGNYWDYGGPKRLFRFGTRKRPGDGLRVEGLTVDQRAEDTGVRVIDAQVKDGLHVEDVEVVGKHDTGTWGPGLFTITESSGTGLVRSFKAPDGADASVNCPGDIRHGPTGILCNNPHKGSITFENCALGGFPDNGIYASGGTGDVHVKGGYFENSGTASLRLGVRKGSIQGATIIVNHQPWDIGQEGIRLDYGNWIEVDDVEVKMYAPYGEGLRILGGVKGAKVTNSNFRMESPGYVPILLEEDAGEAYLRDLSVRMNGNQNAIRIRGKDGGQVGLKNVLIKGQATGERMRHAIRCERDDVDFRDVNIQQHGGPNRRGLHLGGDNALVYHCYMTTSHRPLAVKGSNIRIQDCGLRSDRGIESMRLYEGADDIRLKSNWLPHGITDKGATNVVETGTSGS